MRYFSYEEFRTEPEWAFYVETKSEEDIRREYYPVWYQIMCERFGKEYVDSTYCFLDCVEDWITVNWAWEVVE